MSSEHAWNLIGVRWGERCRDAGWRARERGLTRARLAVGDLAKGDKNSSDGPRRSRILQTGPSWLGLGRKQTRWGESSSVNLWIVGVTLGSPNSGQCDTFQNRPSERDRVRMGLGVGEWRKTGRVEVFGYRCRMGLGKTVTGTV